MGIHGTRLMANVLVFVGVLSAQNSYAAANYSEGEVIVKFTPGTTFEQAQKQIGKLNFQVEKALVPDLGIFLVKILSNSTVPKALETLRAINSVIYAQPDHKVTKRQVLPNDPMFDQQWNFFNQANAADVRLTRAWDFGTGGKDREGNELVVAVVDSGLDLKHKDLERNIWSNRGEIAGNGIDDDENGFIDDTHGWNAYQASGAISSDDHGTHVAGIIGAEGNNGLGVAGINWEVKIMAVAASDSRTSVVMAGYGYVLKQKQLWLQTKGKKGANIVATNSSFGVDGADCTSNDFPLWNDLYNEMGKVGILSAAATANAKVDVDTQGDVPTGCSSPYLINVTNTDKADVFSPRAGYGKRQIHLAAPGTDILSTVPGDSVTKMSGCSMSTPHVAGAVAFLYSAASRDFSALTAKDPGAAALRLKRVLLETVDPLAELRDITASGGRLNLGKAAEAMGKFRH